MDSSDHMITDEMLSAWLDSALDKADCRAVERALEEYPQLNRRLARMMRNDRQLRRHFQAETDRPVPQSIATLLEPAQGPSGAAASSFVERVRDWFVPSSPLMLASALALVAAVGVGVVVMTNGSTPGDEMYRDSAMARAMPSSNTGLQDFLDSQPSGQAMAIGDDLRGVVDMSFEHADGHFCRQYRVAIPDRPGGIAGVACREGNDWRAELAQRIDAPLGEADMFHAAGGQAASAIDDYIVDNMTGDLLVGESEVELIERNWRQR